MHLFEKEKVFFLGGKGKGCKVICGLATHNHNVLFLKILAFHLKCVVKKVIKIESDKIYKLFFVRLNLESIYCNDLFYC